MEPRTGPLSNTTGFVIFLGLCFLMIILVGFTVFVEQPYVRIIKFGYKSQYHEKFIVPEGYDVETVGRKWAMWDTDETGIQKMCDLFNKSAGYFNENSTHAVSVGLGLWEDFIVAFLTELEKTDVTNPGFQGFPWGKNWYQFSISAPTNFAYYIVNKKSSAAIKKSAAAAIQYLIIDPEHSLGYTRDKANSAMMVFPWTLSHMITGTLDDTNPSYLYAIQQYDLRPNTNIKANEDGIHLDYSYLTHSGVYAFGYLDSIDAIYPDASQVIPEIKNMNLPYHIDQIHSKLWHKTIPLSGSTLFHRRRERTCGLYKGTTKTPRAVCVPSMRYLRVFDDKFQWSIRIGQNSIAYYECDQAVYDMGLYSCLCKQAFYESDNPKQAPFPATGFIYKEGQTTLPEVDPNPGNLLHPTTHPYYQSTLTNRAHSYVFVDYDENIAYFFSLHIIYDPLLKVHIDESGYLTLDDYHLRYWCVMDTWDQPGMIIYWGGKEYKFEEIDKPSGHKAVVECDYYLETDEGSVHGTTESDIFTASIHTINPIYDNFLSTEELADRYIIVEKHDKPFVLCPAETMIMKESLTVKWKNNADVRFVWNAEWNQYLHEDYVPGPITVY